jgi:predicted PurR-regulated permease PerM
VIYAVLLAIFSLVVFMMIPPITEQIGQIVSNFPGYYEKISIGIHKLQDGAISGNTAVGNDSIVSTLESLNLTLAQTTKSIFVTITGIFGGLFSLLIVLVITFYLTVEENALKKFVKFVVPSRHRTYTMDLINRMQMKIGMWLRGQLLLSLIVGILTYIGLNILGVKYALLLALSAGILEIIPYLGPWLSGVPAVLVAFSDSLVKVLLVILLYLLVQQLENHLIVPKLMQKMVGLNPIIVIMAILVGAKLGGVIGGLLGVPVAAAISVYLADIIKDKKGAPVNLG